MRAKSASRDRWMVGSALALGLLLGGRAAAKDELPTISLADANLRWANATCVLRYAVPIKKGVDDDGASRSPIMRVPSPRGEKQVHIVFTVSDRAGLAAILRDGEIPAGTVFLARGWDLSRPESEEGLGLQLRFRDAPVEMRVGFIGRWGSTDSFSLAGLYQVEKYLRIDAFQVRAADEVLAAAPAAALVAAPPVSAAPAPPPQPARLEVLLHAAAVRPTQVAAGGEVELILTYELGGGGVGALAEVQEKREIWFGDRLLRTLETPAARGLGAHHSGQRLRLPASLGPGVYKLRGCVAASGSASCVDALFEVVAP